MTARPFMLVFALLTGACFAPRFDIDAEQTQGGGAGVTNAAAGGTAMTTAKGGQPAAGNASAGSPSAGMGGSGSSAECPGGTKSCNGTCLPMTEEHGCADASCAPCGPLEVCSGEPSSCSCTPDADPCATAECGSAKDSCGTVVECPDTCAGTSKSVCLDNRCHEPPSGNACFGTACKGTRCELTIAPPSTPCRGGGTCSSSLPGVCERPAIFVSGAGYDVDATEVTRGQYSAFLAANGGDARGQPDVCSWNATYIPKGEWPGSLNLTDYPVSMVDWCDARAYCEWAGRRLCGKRGGGPLPYDLRPKGADSQWVFACQPAAGGDYPYGSVYDPDACNGKPDATAASAVASYTACTGGGGLFDMSGNVAEWQDACEPYPEGFCVMAGGAYGIPDYPELALTCTVGIAMYRNESRPALGFRCCSD